MAPCRLEYRLQVPAAELVEQVRNLAKEYQGEFQGDEHSGVLSLPLLLGTIGGEYTIADGQLTLQITTKPFWVGCETIDATIKQYLPALA